MCNTSMALGALASFFKYYHLLHIHYLWSYSPPINELLTFFVMSKFQNLSTKSSKTRQWSWEPYGLRHVFPKRKPDQAHMVSWHCLVQKLGLLGAIPNRIWLFLVGWIVVASGHLLASFCAFIQIDLGHLF